MSLALRAFLSTGSPQADEREAVWAVSCFCAVAALWALDWYGAVQGGWTPMVKIASVMVLGSGCYTIWSTNRIWDVPARSFRRSLALWLARVQDVLRPGGHAEARVLSLGADSGSLVVAVEAMARSEQPLTNEIAQGVASSEAIDAVIAEIAKRLESLATGTRAITQHISRVSSAASGTAQAAFVASKSIGEMSARIAAVAEAAAGLKRILLQVGSTDDQGAGEITRETAHAAMSGIETLLAEVAGLKQSAEESDVFWQRFVATMIEKDGASEELNQRMALHTEENAALFARFDAIGKSVAGLRKNLKAMETSWSRTQNASATVWQAAEQFPGRAETIARLLRELPKFPPKARRHGT